MSAPQGKIGERERQGDRGCILDEDQSRNKGEEEGSSL